MTAHKYTDRVCAICLTGTILLTLAFVHGEALGLQPLSGGMGYEDRLFDTDAVHTIDIVMDGWEDFLDSCENEEYEACAVVIDGEACGNVGIRAKGNTSLTTVSSMGSSRYSFKLEFDHYDSGKSYYGLDKLSLNNTIQDTTYMKDYLVYRLMASFGVNAPLCSYVWLTVNGEDWGLYLAVEGVEDAFLQRNYGAGHGALYKPDSLSFGGGRGNGGAFDPAALMDGAGSADHGTAPSAPPAGGGPGGGDPPAMPSGGEVFPGGRPDGMGSSDVKLQYIDDDPDSYANIFDNAKTAVDEADQVRLIRSLKALSQRENLASILDVEAVIRYFVVHNFVCNDDSYTGSMVHNYYLYEANGQLSMIPWDYNLAFGTFQAADASAAVNTPIDTPVSGGDSRPMVDWIFDSGEYTTLYHQYFAQFLELTDFSALIDQTAGQIAPYVEKDPTAFYSYEEFVSGMSALEEFCRLRTESVTGQLAGTIPSTAAGQTADPSPLVDASRLTLSDMGSMGGGMAPGGAAGGRQPDQPPENFAPEDTRPATGSFGEGGSAPPLEQTTGGTGGAVLLALSAILLAAGLIVAALFKRGA